MSYGPLTILYADDDVDDRDFFFEAVQMIDRQHRILSASNGLEVIEILNHTSELPDVVILDVNMPRMTGYECLRALKSSEKTRDIPVVIYSTYVTDDDCQKYNHCGAFDAVEKAKTFDRMISVLQNVLGKIGQEPLSSFQKRSA